jgi:hypothetical protein
MRNCYSFNSGKYQRSLQCVNVQMPMNSSLIISAILLVGFTRRKRHKDSGQIDGQCQEGELCSEIENWHRSRFILVNSINAETARGY